MSVVARDKDIELNDTTKNIINIAISSISDLATIRAKCITYLTALNRVKEAQPINFRIANYRKWIDKLEAGIKSGIVLNSIENIKKQKFTTKLEANLIDILETGEMSELSDAKIELEKLEEELQKFEENLKDVDKKDASLSLALTSSTSTKMLAKKNGVVGKSKRVGTGTGTDVGNNVTGLDNTEHMIFDISSMKSIPKLLSGKQRPTDPIKASIYDLLMVHDIGEEGAAKLVKSGITLELLLDDWNQYVAKDPKTNYILMYSQMERPTKYSVNEWKHMNQTKRNEIQADILKSRLECETKYLHKLHYAQLIGIKHFFNIRAERIPRDEVTQNEKVLKCLANHFNKDVVLTLCGSYRRGLESSGDIDCLITHPLLKTSAELDEEPDFLKKFITKLTDSEYLVDHLTLEGKKKYMGMAEIKGISVCPRRIDIRLIPYLSYGAAILYFTGSKNFNTNMRAHALTLGFTLNEYGLYKLEDGKKGELIECPTEEDIFKTLKMEYKEPVERDI